MVVAKRKRGGQSGNLNALKHGYYPKQFQKRELSELEEIGNLQEEIGIVRVVTRRLLEMARGCKDMRDLISVLSPVTPTINIAWTMPSLAKRVTGLAAVLLKALANRSPLLASRSPVRAGQSQVQSLPQKLVRPGFLMAIASIPFTVFL
jgi:hypothetical protein